MSRRQAYKRLALVAVAALAVGFLAGGSAGLGAVMAGVVFATGALAVELGLGRRRRRLMDQTHDE